MCYMFWVVEAIMRHPLEK